METAGPVDSGETATKAPCGESSWTIPSAEIAVRRRSPKHHRRRASGAS